MKLVHRVDVDALLRSVDLLALIGADTPLRRVASSHGGEWAGPCPQCGGRDRFRTWPRSDRPSFWCRACGFQGDAIDYTRWREQVDFVGACRLLGAGTLLDRPRAQPPPARQQASEPSQRWQAEAARLARVAQQRLWLAGGRTALDWLRGRGLTDATIERARLGILHADEWRDGAAWDLEGRLFVPRGITIPWVAEGAVTHVKVRRAGTPKYLALRGGQPGLYGIDTLAGHREVVLCEGELDCLLLRQECGDLVGAATLGSCTAPLTSTAMTALLPMHVIWLCYDSDDQGEQGADRLAAMSARMRPITVPSGKDVTDFHQRGGSLRSWITFERWRLAQEQPTQNPQNRERCIRADCDRPVAAPRHPFLCEPHGEEARNAAAAFLAEQPSDETVQLRMDGGDVPAAFR